MMKHKNETKITRAKNDDLVSVINALKKSLRYNKVQELEKEMA
jgi:hypothetical protein